MQVVPILVFSQYIWYFLSAFLVFIQRFWYSIKIVSVLLFICNGSIAMTKHLLSRGELWPRFTRLNHTWARAFE